MRITVDGEPIDDPDRSSADIQRCTDVALDHADILFQFDNLQSSPRLSVSAWPTTVPMAELSGEISDEDDARVHEGDRGDSDEELPPAIADDAQLVAARTESRQTSAEPEELVEDHSGDARR